MTVAQAMDLIGIPFARSGRSRDGCDCLGVVCLYYRARGVPFVDPWSPKYAMAWVGGAPELTPGADPSSSRGHWFRPGEGEDAPAALELFDGDLIVTRDGRHVEVYVGGGYVLRSTMTTGSHLARATLPSGSEVWRWRP